MNCISARMAAVVREAEPTPDGWRQFAATGNASFSCSCGATAWGGRSEVEALAAPHLRAIGEVLDA